MMSQPAPAFNTTDPFASARAAGGGGQEPRAEDEIACPSPRAQPRPASVDEKKATRSPIVRSVRSPSEAGGPPSLGPPALPEPPRQRGSRPREIKDAWKAVFTKEIRWHWVTRKVMVGCYLLAVVLCVGHHLFFTSLVGRVVGDEFEQQRTRFIGNVLPYLVQVSLAIVIDMALTQYLFWCLTNRDVAVKTLDAAFTSTSSLHFILCKGMYQELPDVFILALLIALLSFPTTMVTPGTLFVAPGLVETFTVRNVPRLAIDSSVREQSNFFHNSRPSGGPNDGPNSTALLFEGPRTVIWRLLTAAAAMGDLLPLADQPAVNATYRLQFWGPYVGCAPANDSVARMIDAAHDALQATDNGASEVYNGMFAFVPDLSAPGVMGRPNERASDPARAGNELWMSFKRNDSAGWNTDVFPRCSATVYSVCTLYNASYDVSVAYENGRQTVTHAGFDVADLAPVAYPTAKVDASRPGEIAKLSYSSFMWVLSSLLEGSLSLYATDINNKSTPWYNVINSSIEDTALLGSSDLDCFFAVDWLFYNVSWRAPSLQRQQDIAFARNNQSLDYLIPELSVNLTLSLMSNTLLAPLTPTNVTIITPADRYGYHAPTLLASYGAALGLSGLAVALGLAAFARNHVRADRSFSMMVSTTQHSELVDEHLYDRRGSIPVPTAMRDKRVRFRQLDKQGGGWGFVVAVLKRVDGGGGGGEGGRAGEAGGGGGERWRDKGAAGGGGEGVVGDRPAEEEEPGRGDGR